MKFGIPETVNFVLAPEVFLLLSQNSSLFLIVVSLCGMKMNSVFVDRPQRSGSG